MSSEAIRGHPRPPETPRCYHRRPSKAITLEGRPSLRPAAARFDRYSFFFGLSRIASVARSYLMREAIRGH